MKIRSHRGYGFLGFASRMKTLLVDDHALFREGMALMIALRFPQLELLEAGTMDEAMHQLDIHPDTQLLLLDLALPDSVDTLGLCRLRAQAPQLTVVVVSADESAETVLAAIEAGAAGFIPKTARGDVMQEALRVVLDGGVYLPQSLVSAPPEPDTMGLTPRQLDVLRLLVEGHSNKLICRRLALSESTVKTHLETIFRKLDVKSRTQAVVAVAGLGLRLPAWQRGAA